MWQRRTIHTGRVVKLLYPNARNMNSLGSHSMIKCDKRNSLLNNISQMVLTSTNYDRHPLTNTCTPLPYTCRYFTSSHLNFTHLHPTTLHYPLIWLKHI